jgi:hypothetical protein
MTYSWTLLSLTHLQAAREHIGFALKVFVPRAPQLEARPLLMASRMGTLRGGAGPGTRRAAVVRGRRPRRCGGRWQQVMVPGGGNARRRAARGRASDGCRFTARCGAADRPAAAERRPDGEGCRTVLVVRGVGSARKWGPARREARAEAALARMRASSAGGHGAGDEGDVGTAVRRDERHGGSVLGAPR